MSAHTPGPWRIEREERRERGVIWIQDERGWDICESHPSDPETEREANARLIAAAPDLLGALRDLLATFDPDRQAIYEFARERIQKARAALAKAGAK